MNDLALDATTILPSESPTMAHLPERATTRCLVYDFFRAQFALKDAVFPLDEEEFHDPAITELLEYQRIREILVQQGQMYMEDYQDRILPNLQHFLRTLQPQNAQASFNSLSAQIFVDGIRWDLILTYFVFCAELAFQANLERFADVYDITIWMLQYINDHLSPWIHDNGGWVRNSLVPFVSLSLSHAEQYSPQ